MFYISRLFLNSDTVHILPCQIHIPTFGINSSITPHSHFPGSDSLFDDDSALTTAFLSSSFVYSSLDPHQNIKNVVYISYDIAKGTSLMTMSPRESYLCHHSSNCGTLNSPLRGICRTTENQSTQS